MNSSALMMAVIKKTGPRDVPRGPGSPPDAGGGQGALAVSLSARP